MPRPSHAHEPSIGLPRTQPPTPAPAQPITPMSAPLVFDRAAVRAVDRAAIEDYGIPGIVLMENAARGLCDCAMRLLCHSAEHHPQPPPHSALIVCGTGNNGGDGFALARHLHNRCVRVVIAAIGQPRAGTDAAINLDICRRMNLRIVDSSEVGATIIPSEFNLIVDAIFGTGLDRAIDPASEPARLIRCINVARLANPACMVLAVDVPSGMDADTGLPITPAPHDDLCIRATLTATFVGMKKGFLTLDAQRWLGELDEHVVRDIVAGIWTVGVVGAVGAVVVCDIGAPREVIERLGILSRA